MTYTVCEDLARLRKAAKRLIDRRKIVRVIKWYEALDRSPGKRRP